MKKHVLLAIAVCSFIGLGTVAQAAPVSFVQLTGVVGGSPAGTAVFKADLSTLGLADILSITILDNSGGLGGSPGQFSGFDLDAIKLSTTNCLTSACADAAVGLSAFNFTSGLVFSPGTQRLPADPKLFGTSPSGTAVSNAVATLGSFDGNATTAIPGAFGFVSMGDSGSLSFNLTSAVSTSGLFLYIGEVGDNGEVAAGSITVLDRPVGVPEPASAWLLGFGLVGLTRGRKPWLSRA